MPTKTLDAGPAKQRMRICIFGESPLVEEYALLCLNKGFAVQVRLNPVKAARGASRRESGVALAKGIKKVAHPTKAVDIALELSNIALDTKKKNLVEFDRVLGPKVPILSSSVTVTVATQCRWVSRRTRLLGIGALPSLLSGELIELAPMSSTDPRMLGAAKEFIERLGKKAAIVRDSVGLVLPRILCALANEACFALEEGIATPADIDTAMKLGTSYPFGPVEWAERIGVRQIHAVISALRKEVDPQIYRVAPLLERASAAHAKSLTLQNHP